MHALGIELNAAALVLSTSLEPFSAGTGQLQTQFEIGSI
jgi:hypothetical protein